MKKILEDMYKKISALEEKERNQIEDYAWDCDRQSQEWYVEGLKTARILIGSYLDSPH